MEVAWYEKHGEHPDRIKWDDLKRRYVVCDRLWNQDNEYRREVIGDILREHVALRITGIRRCV